MKKGYLVLLLSVALSAVTALGVVKAATPNVSETAPRISFDSQGQPVKTVNLSLSDYPDFTYAAENAVNAVVYVEVSVKYQQQYQMADPFFQFFFGDQYGRQPQQREQKGSGSGVIIRSDGYIVTNNHVVANATSVKVTLNDNKTYDATVVGTDPATDVALIKIEESGLPVIQFADSDNVRLGEWVLAIGSPLGRELQSTITAGIVSAKGRQMNMDRKPGELKIESFIQTDAAVNPGNSGGALVNKQGELIGINTAIVSTTGSYAGYSFAVPSNIVSKVVSDLIDFGSVKRAQLGISMINLDAIVNSEDVQKELKINADDLKLSSMSGVYIGEVLKGGAADKAGIRKGDILTAIEGVTVKNGGAVQEKVNAYHPGDKVTVTVIRDGKKIDLPVEFQGVSDSNVAVSADGTVSFYGATLKAADNGVEIVNSGSGKMAQAGAEDGFVIQYVNEQKVKKPQDVIDIAKKAKRSIFIEGVGANGRPGYFGFGKED
ncbi:MAG: trypsin-like peptidase domain-containing protein [Bacteroidales bacterium]|nr:trypsin-like peptidase domain-containing protein [Bacteroidales bacterium]